MTEPSHRFSGALTAFRLGLQNARDIARLGRLTPKRRSPFETIHEDERYRLRRYSVGDEPRMGAILLIPPVMLVPEIYDVSPEASAVAQLDAAGIDVCAIDLSKLVYREGGADTRMDDYTAAIDDAVDRIVARTGGKVHLAGYSQGGMWAYQTAAYRRSRGIASVITFGSPVDMRRMLPLLDADVAFRVVDVARSLTDLPLRWMHGVPGNVSSNAFRVYGLRKEIKHFAEFVSKLHDRRALEAQESTRRFVAGEGFVPIPLPTLRSFIDEFVVSNRLASGGFVMRGRTVTLDDITCPILCFYGTNDDIGRPSAVRAIRRAAPNAPYYETPIRSGHFGIVVGRRALAKTWPTVAAFIRWCEAGGERPEHVEASPARESDAAGAEDEFDMPLEFELFYESAVDWAKYAWQRAGAASKQVGEGVDALRYQLPRFAALRTMQPDTPVGPAAILSQRAERSPDATCFIWNERAISFSEADARVERIALGLMQRGVREGSRVGVLMRSRPSLYSSIAALNRMGAIAVLLPEDGRVDELLELHGTLGLGTLVVDPERLERALAASPSGQFQVFVLGGGGGARDFPSGSFDLESLDPVAADAPGSYRPNASRADQLLAILVRRSATGLVPAYVTNQRWAVSAYGAAGSCTLTADDTVYSVLPLNHISGLLLGAAAALVAGARLAVADRFEPQRFWSDVRRYGVSVAFYAGDMCRELPEPPEEVGGAGSPFRLLAGSGMRVDVWRRLGSSLGRARVLEFYAATSGNLVLANASGEKVGALGRPIPGTADVAVVDFNLRSQQVRRDSIGRLRRCAIGERGLLIARAERRFIQENESVELLRDAFEPGDAWYATGDIAHRDRDGDYWYDGVAAEVLDGGRGSVLPRQVTDALLTLSGVERCAIFELPSQEVQAFARAEPQEAGETVESWDGDTALTGCGAPSPERFDASQGAAPDEAAVPPCAAPGAFEDTVESVAVVVAMQSRPERAPPDEVAARLGELSPTLRPLWICYHAELPLTAGFRVDVPELRRRWVGGCCDASSVWRDVGGSYAREEREDGP